MQVRLRVGPETYALPVGHVLETAELGDVTHVPGAEPGVLGVRNLRGQILPVVDLGATLGFGRASEPRKLVVVEAEATRIGFAVDEVLDVAELGEPDEPAESELLLGATLKDGELVGFVDVQALFLRLERTA